jgi:tRNA(fMet)-specific endonuclease VapC
VIRYMLDTNICIRIIKDRPDPLCRKLSRLAVGDVAISSIVSAELWYGVASSEKKRQNEAALKDFLDYVEVIGWPSEAGPVYGRIRAELRKRGRPIGAMDLLIAAHAVHLGAVLVTENTKEFERVPDLKIENWTNLRGV